MDRRDPDRHRAQVLPRHPPAGGLVESPVISSIDEVGGLRVSRVRRGDGSTFTVTVPAGGIDARQRGSHLGTPWIREDGGARRVPESRLDGLAARVGLHLAPDPSPGPSAR